MTKSKIELTTVAREADDAFWQVVVKHFPSATTGDLSPLTTLRLHLAEEEAIAEWVWANVPAKDRYSMKKEFVLCEADIADAWTCVCGNMPHIDGFYPCDRAGRLVEPTPEDWTSGLYVCSGCGRLINPDTLEVVGRAAE
jgi:hypothetical protein